MQGMASGKVTPSKGVFYSYAPLLSASSELSKLCNAEDIYNFKYEFDMRSVPDRNLIKEVILLIYNPQERKWLKAETIPYEGEDNVSIKLNYGEESFSTKNIGIRNRYHLFLGMSKFKLVAEPIMRNVLDGQGFQIEKTVTPDTAFRISLSNEIQGPEIIANFKNPKGSIDPLTGGYTYSVEMRANKLLNVAIAGSKGGNLWEIYNGGTNRYGSNAWKKLVWNNAPYYSQLEFIIENLN